MKSSGGRRPRRHPRPSDRRETLRIDRLYLEDKGNYDAEIVRASDDEACGDLGQLCRLGTFRASCLYFYKWNLSLMHTNCTGSLYLRPKGVLNDHPRRDTESDNSVA